MKFDTKERGMEHVYVTLYARVWIEMLYHMKHHAPIYVTLYARVWIEIETSSC